MVDENRLVLMEEKLDFDVKTRTLELDWTGAPSSQSSSPPALDSFLSLGNFPNVINMVMT